MLSRTLKKSIESYYGRVRTSSPFFRLAAEGKLTPQEVSRLLGNVLYLIRFTPEYLSIGVEKAKASGDKELEEFYRRKMEEEIGHDKWAEEDMRKMRERFNVEPDQAVTVSMIKLVDFLRHTVGRDPAGYVAYILLAEYFTVLSTPELLKHLESKCGVGPDMLSVLGNHAELDRDHVDDNLKVVDSFKGREVGRRMEMVLGTAMEFHWRFLGELVERAL